MRAIETGRWVGQVAPTGFTAVIDDRGNVLERTSVSERAVIQREMELREGLTLYTRWGNTIALVLAAAVILVGWLVEARSTRTP
jgi:apolipoprotein N-acyltransferase